MKYVKWVPELKKRYIKNLVNHCFTNAKEKRKRQEVKKSHAHCKYYCGVINDIETMVNYQYKCKYS